MINKKGHPDFSLGIKDTKHNLNNNLQDILKSKQICSGLLPR